MTSKKRRDLKKMHNIPQLFSGKMLQNFWEVWVDVPGLDNYVMASNFGRIYFKISKQVTDGTLNSMDSPYLRVKVNKKSYLVHRLIGKAFHPNPKKKEDINHINGLKWFNWALNIEWSTRSENIRHAYSVLNHPRFKGEKSSLSKLTDTQRIEIKDLYQAKKYSQKKLAALYNVGQSTISRIILN